MTQPARAMIALLTFTYVAGCDVAKPTATHARFQASEKSLQACDQWTLSDQSELYAGVEVVETGDLSSKTLVLQRSAPQPVWSLEFTLADPETGQPVGEWIPLWIGSTDGTSQTFRHPLTAPEGTNLILRVQVGDQPEVLTPWTLTFGEK